MRRYIKSYRTRSNVRDTNALRTQFIRELTEETRTLLGQMTQQFAQDLQSQSLNILQEVLNKNGNDSKADAGADGGISSFGNVKSVSQLLSTGVRYLVSRPRTSTNTAETSRSQDANSSFKLSRAQSLAEAGVMLAKGDKNL